MLYRYVWIYGIDSTGSRPWLLDRACLPVVACYLLPAAAAAAVAAAAGWRLWRFVVFSDLPQFLVCHHHELVRSRRWWFVGKFQVCGQRESCLHLVFPFACKVVVHEGPPFEAEELVGSRLEDLVWFPWFSTPICWQGECFSEAPPGCICA